MSDLTKPFSRRDFLEATTCGGVAWALAQLGPLPVFAGGAPQDSRASRTLVADKGFASVTKIADGVYATISDPSKGYQSLCNGGFIVGRDSALCIEGLATPAGASFQMEVLRHVSKVPVQAAVDTHYHSDHTMGNSFYGGMGIPVWAHFRTAMRMGQTFAPIQNEPAQTYLAPYLERVKAAKTDLERSRAKGDLAAINGMRDQICGSLISLPNHAITAGPSPTKFDLGGLTAVVEMYSGHSATDVIVRVPERNVIFTGDLLLSRCYPATFDAAIPLWRETLKTFAGFDKDTVFVPGHGPVCGQESVAQNIAVFDDLAAQGEKFFAAGASAEEAAQRYVVPPAFKDFFIYCWGLTIGTAMNKLYFDWQTRPRSSPSPDSPK